MHRLLLLSAGLVVVVVGTLWLLTKWLFCSICCPAFFHFHRWSCYLLGLLHAQPIVSGFLEQFLKPSLLSCPLMKLKAKRKKEMKIHSVSAFTLQDLFRYVGQKNNHHDHHKVPRTFLRSTFWPLLLFGESSLTKKFSSLCDTVDVTLNCKSPHLSRMSHSGYRKHLLSNWKQLLEIGTDNLLFYCN